MGWTKGKCHNVVPFDYGASGFEYSWPHWKYETFRYEKEKEEEPWIVKKWSTELGKVGEGEWLIVHGHCDGGMRLKPGRDPKGSIDAGELCKRLQPLKAKCHIVIYACLSLRFAIAFGRLWAKGHSNALGYYGTKIPVDAKDLSDSDVIPIGDPLRADLEKLAGDWDKQLKDAKDRHRWVGEGFTHK